MSATLTVRMSEQEKDLITKYADIFGVSTGKLMRDATIEAIEDAIDIEIYKKAKAEFEKDPVTYSFDETMQMLGLS